MFQSGVLDHLIKLHGDWRSDAYQAYITLPLSTHSQVADIMALGLSPRRQLVTSLLQIAHSALHYSPFPPSATYHYQG